HRKQILFTAIALAALAAIVVPTGIAMRHSFVNLGLSACRREMGTGQFINREFSNECNNAFRQFDNQYGVVHAVSVLLVFLPLVIGLFWGAPLVAGEVEHGTHRLVWTQ